MDFTLSQRRACRLGSAWLRRAPHPSLRSIDSCVPKLLYPAKPLSCRLVQRDSAHAVACSRSARCGTWRGRRACATPDSIIFILLLPQLRVMPGQLVQAKESVRHPLRSRAIIGCNLLCLSPFSFTSSESREAESGVRRSSTASFTFPGPLGVGSGEAGAGASDRSTLAGEPPARLSIADDAFPRAVAPVRPVPPRGGSYCSPDCIFNTRSTCDASCSNLAAFPARPRERAIPAPSRQADDAGASSKRLHRVLAMPSSASISTLLSHAALQTTSVFSKNSSAERWSWRRLK